MATNWGPVKSASQTLKRVGRVRVKNFRDGQILGNTWNPVDKTFVHSSSSTEYTLYNSQGKKLKLFAPPDTGTPEGNRFNGDTQAVWELTIPNSKVPKGKKNWIPFARSANNKIWLLKNKSSGEFKLLKIPN